MKPVDITAQLNQYRCISQLGNTVPTNIPTPQQLGARIWLEQNTRDYEHQLLLAEEKKQLARKRANKKTKEIAAWICIFLGFCISVGLFVGIITGFITAVTN